MRSALVRWITGASRLPHGRWDALDPKLTIVPKGDKHCICDERIAFCDDVCQLFEGTEVFQ